MDEKQLLTDPLAFKPRRARFGLWHYLALAALACVAIVRFPLSLLKHSGHCHDGLVSYPGEHVGWKACGDLKGRPLECSEINVPMDQFNAENSGNKTFSIPLIRLRGKNGTQNLLLNPGGPGGSGLEFLFRRGEQLNAIVGEGFHLLSFDPRGINGSRPQALCYPDKEVRRDHSLYRGDRIIEDSPEVYAWTTNEVKACQDTMGEYGGYINTPQTAADMNSILDALGQEEMVYWGFSYGTILGQTYATLFPERSSRVIIDGVANNYDWYGNKFDVESLFDTENVLLGFFDECIKAGQNCTLSGHAKSKEELWDKVMSLVDGLESQPLSVYINNTAYGLLNRNNILNDAIFPALYKPATWYDLADRLAKLLEGNATEAFLAYSTKSDGWDMNDDGNYFVTMNDAVVGPKNWPQDRQTFLDELVPFLNQSLFGQTESVEYYTKQQWIIPKTHNYTQISVETAHPLLILSTTFDPVCPLISARSANAAFKDSQIIELKGYGHCTVSMPSTCIAGHVRNFLYNGTLPAEYTQCEVDGPYFIKPEDDGKAVALKHFDSSEEQRIHLAQVELAKDPLWPRW